MRPCSGTQEQHFKERQLYRHRDFTAKGSFTGTESFAAKGDFTGTETFTAKAVLRVQSLLLQNAVLYMQSVPQKVQEQKPVEVK